ncbi:hypothetical protein [Methylobacterium haplocladii]|uniref:Uncharacterized protein n=1 Tax=Methylobacterium haplocladii TaxID=1176176 RepID=A0A512IJS2_9HYPH|nr:hypothetical protein [Methylobacterium haplocladii]GEO97888.1 hypothetical protein MHA02_02760 [Methylobacterium haplocladii]GJD84877.1 hypothetical protein HPGCJGGD_2760 [Methylobacterium haplocladii]GLS57479.1 hypothetical protein GCM10007887_01340 [Methylobacterium haplocladii]
MTAPSPTTVRRKPAPTVVTLGQWRLRRRHLLMLALAVEVLVMGARRAEHYHPPGITVDLPSTQGHIIT